MPLYEFEHVPECNATFESWYARADAVFRGCLPRFAAAPVYSEKISAFASISKGGNSASSGNSSCAPGGG